VVRVVSRSMIDIYVINIYKSNYEWKERGRIFFASDTSAATIMTTTTTTTTIRDEGAKENKHNEKRSDVI